MNAPISFPPILPGDTSDEPLIVEAEIEGYTVRRVYVDQGASVDDVRALLLKSRFFHPVSADKNKHTVGWIHKRSYKSVGED